MNSLTKTGFLNIELRITVVGYLNKTDSDQIKNNLMKYLDQEKISYEGKFKYVDIETLEVEKSGGHLDTTSR